MEFDGLGMLIAISVAICYGQLPLWYLLLGLGRQLFLAGLWLRQRAGLSINEMMPSANRRIIAGIQMGFICVILWPILTPPLTTITCILFSIPLAASFGRDWLVVSGQLRPNTNRYQMLHRWSRRIIQAWGPVACRTIGTLIGSWFMWRSWPQLYAWHGLVETIQIDSIRSVWLGLLLSAPFFLVTYAAGILGRVSALLLLAVAFTDLIVGGPNLLNILFLTTLAWVIQFGSGLFSIWSPEEALLRRRAGTQP